MNRKDSIKNKVSYGKYGNVSILGVGYWESMLEILCKRMFKGMYFEWETSYLRNCLVTIPDRRLCNIIGNSLCDFGAVTLRKDSCIEC